MWRRRLSSARGKSSPCKIIYHLTKTISTINSPKILELSGIGRADILSSIGVDLKVNLPGVGENVQEHMRFMMTYELNLSPEFIKEHIKD